MDKEIYDLAVTTDKSSYIYIKQTNYGTADAEIAVHSDQVDLLVKWLNEAKDELRNA